MCMYCVQRADSNLEWEQLQLSSVSDLNEDIELREESLSKPVTFLDGIHMKRITLGWDAQIHLQKMKRKRNLSK